MTGIEDHHVGAIGGGGGAVAKRRQHIGHAIRIIDIHLAPVGLDEQFL